MGSNDEDTLRQQAARQALEGTRRRKKAKQAAEAEPPAVEAEPPAGEAEPPVVIVVEEEVEKPRRKGIRKRVKKVKGDKGQGSPEAAGEVPGAIGEEVNGEETRQVAEGAEALPEEEPVVNGARAGSKSRDSSSSSGTGGKVQAASRGRGTSSFSEVRRAASSSSRSSSRRTRKRGAGVARRSKKRARSKSSRSVSKRRGDSVPRGSKKEAKSRSSRSVSKRRGGSRRRGKSRSRTQRRVRRSRSVRGRGGRSRRSRSSRSPSRRRSRRASRSRGSLPRKRRRRSSSRNFAGRRRFSRSLSRRRPFPRRGRSFRRSLPRRFPLPDRPPPFRSMSGPAPEKFSERLWERPREQLQLATVGELAPQGVSWVYPLKDESRRSFAAFLRNPFTAAQCHDFFHRAKDGTSWDQPQGPNGPIPRKTAWMVARGCACTYRYGQIEVQPQEFPTWMLSLMRLVMPLCGFVEAASWPNSCNLNLYEDGAMSVGWHADDERLFQGKLRDIRILSLSLGASRRFELRANWPEAGEKPVHVLTLADGDLCTMEGMLQKHYQHRVPREGPVLSPRINLTWRWVVAHGPVCPAKRFR